MPDMVFHPVAPGILVVGDCPLVLLRVQDGSWKISAAEGIDKAWQERNETLFEQKFRLLRDGRDCLRALLAVDPMPELPYIPIRALKRQSDGTYLVRAPNGQYARVSCSRSPDQLVWQVNVYDKDVIIHPSLPARSLWEVRATLSLLWEEKQ